MKDWNPGTQGPWQVTRDENNIACEPWTDAIAIEAPNDPECGSIPSIVAWTTRPDRANAPLIAAASELYYLACRMRDLFLKHGKQIDYENAFREYGIGAMLKAEGKIK